MDSHETFTGQTVQVLYVVDTIYAGIGGRDMVRISLRHNAAGCNQRNSGMSHIFHSRSRLYTVKYRHGKLGDIRFPNAAS